MKAQIATALKISENQIIRVEEWANVFFVVVSGKGGRFVSKKIGANQMTEAQEFIALSVEIAKAKQNDCLPELIGSSKQINWADSIRGAAISSYISGYRASEQEVEASLACGFVCLQALKKAWGLAQTKTEAKYWIDNRRNFSGYRGN